MNIDSRLAKEGPFMKHHPFARYVRTQKLFFSFVLIVCLVTILSACGGSSPTTTTSKFGGNIKVGLDADVTTLDPILSSSLYDRQVMLNIYDTLVRLDASNSIVPDLATSWSYTTPTQLEFTLRTDVTFQDGTPFNADAVVFN